MYEGAGILFYTDSDSARSLLLARRAHHPQKGAWSIPGGKRSRRDRSLFDTAIRETEEEFCDKQPISRVFELAQRHVWEEGSFPVVIISLPLFHWHSYLVPLPALTPLESIQLSDEFTDVGWFSRHQLPRHTHTGVRYACWRAGI